MDPIRLLLNPVCPWGGSRCFPPQCSGNNLRWLGRIYVEPAGRANNMPCFPLSTGIKLIVPCWGFSRDDSSAVGIKASIHVPSSTPLSEPYGSVYRRRQHQVRPPGIISNLQGDCQPPPDRLHGGPPDRRDTMITRAGKAARLPGMLQQSMTGRVGIHLV